VDSRGARGGCEPSIKAGSTPVLQLKANASINKESILIEYYRAKLPGPKTKRLIEGRLDIIETWDGFDGGENLYKSIFFPSTEKEITFTFNKSEANELKLELVYYKVGSEREEKYNIVPEIIE